MDVESLIGASTTAWNPLTPIRSHPQEHPAGCTRSEPSVSRLPYASPPEVRKPPRPREARSPRHPTPSGQTRKSRNRTHPSWHDSEAWHLRSLRGELPPPLHLFPQPNNESGR